MPLDPYMGADIRLFYFVKHDSGTFFYCQAFIVGSGSSFFVPLGVLRTWTLSFLKDIFFSRMAGTDAACWLWLKEICQHGAMVNGNKDYHQRFAPRLFCFEPRPCECEGSALHLRRWPRKAKTGRRLRVPFPTWELLKGMDSLLVSS